MTRNACFVVLSIALWTPTLTIGGCGGDEGLGQAPQSCSTDFESFKARYIQSYCTLLTRCPVDWSFFTPRDQAACEDYLGRILGDALWEIHSSMKAGRTCINTFALNQCTSSLQSDACSDLMWYGPQGCMDVFVGRLPPGGACYQDEECRDGYCNLSADCPGVCEPYALMGETCDDWQVECDPSLECVSGTCRLSNPDPPPQEGQPCEYDCDFGLYCTNAGICQRQGQRGDPCEQNWDGDTDSCGLDLICYGEPGVCIAVEYTRSPGGPCMQITGDAATVCDFFENLVCLLRTETSGECIRLPGEGEPCLDRQQPVYPSEFPCALGLYCDPATGQCRSDRKELGEPCTSPEECVSGYCDYSTTNQMVCADPLICD